MTIHDELMFECPPEELEIVKQIIIAEMERPVEPMSIPMKVDMKILDRWEAKE